MYEKIYSFNLLNELKESKRAFCCDKKQQEVFCVNELPAGYFTRILKECETDDNRYEFWSEKEGAEND